MDKDRIEGSAEQAKGKVKEFAGKVTGDSKTEAERQSRPVERQSPERRRWHQGQAARELAGKEVR